MIKTIRFIIFLFIMATISNACYYDNEEELYPQATPCDTSNVTYTQTITGILNNNGCIACHNAAIPSGQVVLDNYADVKTNADNGKLWGAVNHVAGYSPMPQNAGKLSDCNLTKIRIWLDDGAPNN